MLCIIMVESIRQMENTICPVISTGMVFLYGMEAIIWTLPNLKQFEIS